MSLEISDPLGNPVSVWLKIPVLDEILGSILGHYLQN
jgi:hypothetical protein